MNGRGSLEQALGASVASRQSLGGGSINDAERLDLSDGRTVFAKTRQGARTAEFEAEAAGLRWLGECEALNVPNVLAVTDSPPSLALEWIEPGRLSTDGAERFGRGLAEMHRAGAPAFGAVPGSGTAGEAGLEMSIGSLGFPVIERRSWGETYALDRLMPAMEAAAERGSLSGAGVTAVERVCERIDELIGPPEPPARLHGDLWSGNVYADDQGEAWLIDPTAYGGHREIDLAMLRLFGAPSERIFDAYDEAVTLAEGHADRIELWQLLPLLTHAALFGGSYGDSATRAAERYR